MRRFLCLYRTAKFCIKSRLKPGCVIVPIHRFMSFWRTRRTAFPCPLRLAAAIAGIVMRWRLGSGGRAKSAGSAVSEIRSDRRGLLPEWGKPFLLSESGNGNLHRPARERYQIGRWWNVYRKMLKGVHSVHVLNITIKNHTYRLWTPLYKVFIRYS